MSKWKHCSVAGCTGIAYKRGLCRGHFERLKKTGDVRADVPIRKPMIKLGKVLNLPRNYE